MNQSNGPFWPPNGLSAEIPSNMAMPHLQSPYSKNANMDTESVLSGFSERSRKSRNGTYASLITNPAVNSSVLMASNQTSNASPLSPYHTSFQQPSNSVQIAQSLAGSTAGRNMTGGPKVDRLFGQPGKYESPYDINQQEVIEVQTLEDNWGDNTTAITGNTSDHSGSFEDLSRSGKDALVGTNLQLQCQMWAATVIAIVLCTCAFLSPIIMLILPKLDMFEWKTKECGPECDGLMIGFVFKLLILAVGSWALFLRRPKATLPRMCVYRCAVLTCVVITMVIYWLLYSLRIAEKRFSEEEEDVLNYYSIMIFATSFVDVLLFIHYVAVILLEIRHLDPQYFIKVVRSPDGHSQCYNIGKISIQRASVIVLEKYYQDFPFYNSHMERVPSRRTRRPSVSSRHTNAALKYYDVDGVTGPPSMNGNKPPNSANMNPLSPKSILAQNTAANAMTKTNRPYLNGGSTISEGRGNRRDRDTASHVSGHSEHRYHNDRYYDEHEYERRVRKRKSRLISVTEEAFTHIKRAQQNRSGPSIPMDPKEAAQTIFPSIAKTLQKYLRMTRQQPRHTVQAILSHLSTCLSYDLSPKAFLEKYLSNSGVLANGDEQKPVQTWSLICDTLLSRSIETGTVFLLRQGDISLLVTVHSLPHFNIAEQVIDPKSNRFVFRLNSETSV